MTTSRKARLKKVAEAERQLEGVLLTFKDEITHNLSNRLFRHLYYLARLAKKAR